MKANREIIDPQAHLLRADTAAARLLETNDLVQSVELFGSVARGQVGKDSDVDLALIVPKTHFIRWAEEIDNGWDEPEIDRDLRVKMAARVLNMDLEFLNGQPSIDTILLPKDWKEDIESAGSLGRFAVFFLHSVLHDAVEYDSSNGSFLRS